MQLPALSHPECYQGLYVFDFGEHVAVGYTAEEIEMLLQDSRHAGGRAYKIHSVTPDGHIALRGMSRLDTSVQEGIVFFRHDAEEARADFNGLKRAAALSAPPTPVRWRLGSDPQRPWPHFTLLVYCAAYSDGVGRWLQNIQFAGGDQVEAGSGVPAFLSGASLIEEVAIAPDPRYHSRPCSQVLASVHLPVQRLLSDDCHG